MRKGLAHCLCVLAAVTMLASCTPAREGARLELSVASDNSDVIRYVQRILYARLSDASGGMLADVRTSYFPDTKKLVFDIMHSAPSPEGLRYLYETQGDYRVFATDGDGEDVDWITNSDISSVSGGRSKRDAKVFVGLNGSAARRVADVSWSNVGETIKTSLDGELIYETEVTWTMGPFYSFDVETVDKAKLMAAVLRYPALPTEVKPYDAAKPVMELKAAP